MLIVLLVRCIDLQLAQIIPMTDEETGEDGPAILKAKICDPYVMLLKIDGSVAIWKCAAKDLELQEQRDQGDLKVGHEVGQRRYMLTIL